MSKTSRRPEVRLIRGPFLELAPHADHCADESQLGEYVTRLRSVDPAPLLVADLFSGAGGLSLGLEQSGMRTVFAVDHDQRAIQTHAHHFGGMSVDWDLSDRSQVERVGTLLKDIEIDVVAGGPPCQPFSKAGRSMMRHLVREGKREPKDTRRDLWKSYLDIIETAAPRAVIMENVPDMALDREMFILREMVSRLESIGYSVEEKVVETKDYGVPQFRQRLILVGIADHREFRFPPPVDQQETVRSAISDLPPVEGGDRPPGGAEGYFTYAPDEEPSQFARRMRADLPPEHRHRVYDHITRPVREDDRRAFESMDHTTRYSQLDPSLKRYRDDIFDDKYKRLDPDKVSRTITAHIAKDGYWYIHPFQHRTITVREAARLQTFPDWFRFAGPPSAAFKQIGNAVPPQLGFALGGAVVDWLTRDRRSAQTTDSMATSLAEFFERVRSSVYEGRAGVAVPWLASGNRWQALVGEVLLDRLKRDHLPHAWRSVRDFASPESVLADAEDFLERSVAIGRADRGQRILQIAELVASGEHDLTDAGLSLLVSAGLIGQAIADVVVLITVEGDPDDCELPVLITKGTLRVVARLVDEPHGDLADKNRLTDGRIAVAAVIGNGPRSRDAHLALMEIAGRYCHPGEPNCLDCPMNRLCRSSLASEQLATRLPIAE